MHYLLYVLCDFDAKYFKKQLHVINDGTININIFRKKKTSKVDKKSKLVVEDEHNIVKK